MAYSQQEQSQVTARRGICTGSLCRPTLSDLPYSASGKWASYDGVYGAGNRWVYFDHNNRFLGSTCCPCSLSLELAQFALALVVARPPSSPAQVLVYMQYRSATLSTRHGRTHTSQSM